MHRPQVKIVLLALMLMMASMGEAAEPSGAAVTGVVRDAQGVAQMGALVQILAANSVMVGSAFTDIRGRYTVANLLPGRYQVRASAALFLPARRGGLQLHSGAQAIVDLTLNTLFETSAWLPAERRRADEPGDDWKWTLRSAANRPILRWDENGDVITESSKPVHRIDVALVGGDGGFGDGGMHTIVSQDRITHNGASTSSVSADIGAPSGSFMGGPSARLAAQYSKKNGFAGEMSTVVSYQSHPELVGADGSAGLQVMQVASARKMALGDMADVEAGGTVYVVRTSTLTTASQPFLKVTVRPASKWTVGYRLATAQNLQSFDGLSAVPQDLPPAAMSQGRLQTARGLHQEFAVGRKVGQGVLQVAYYHDSLDNVLISGGGAPGAADLTQAAAQPEQDGVLTDTATGTFHLMGTGYRTQGVNITLSEPVTPNMWLALEYTTGAALAVKDGATLTLANESSSLAPDVAQSATVALKGKVLQSGTRVRMAYRWEPTRFVSAVDPYAAFGDQAYLSCYIRQAIRMGHLLPTGLDATIDVTNLLAQGYKPFLSADGQTLFLAQAPRTVQAGLAFNF